MRSSTAACISLRRMRTSRLQHRLECRILVARLSSTWQAVPALETSLVDEFRTSAFDPALPARLPRNAVNIDAKGTWLSTLAQDSLNYKLLDRHAESLFLPMELSIPATDAFHRTDAAPLSIFLESVRAAQAAEPQTREQTARMYIAQCPLNRLPPELAAPFTTPQVVREAGRGDIYDSSIWLGLPPTSTPLHRDPNPNLFVQVAGRKVVRLRDPDSGSELYARLRQGGTGRGFGADERTRGEEMMKGDEKRMLEDAVWQQDFEAPGQGFEVELEAGEVLFIPRGWWHAIRSVGDGINMSVNWWFR